ncbi:sec-independent protein translocase protein TatA [bacterium BMS3Bbin12]|nr:sec-independent protein translocase protein TatA [bacterium BMS3Abin12]GBE47291.1 sec-independent protein translocase protein TatA [bacterium BMS3Bbin12]GBE50682.1 sec-independent protein translocase protein TatA [bacterium BMS3Bbin13]HDJ86445.1 twin-arginine translocase TatA/TatE family subunit [Chromatiales bacterium]HDO34126.1 twin-arginine translocase TatA/TatE family subunit [Chromatiales bacterium]
MDFGLKELLVILLITLVLFGGKRVKSLGSDLGTAIRGFRKAMKESEGEPDAQAQVIEHAAEPRQNHPT